MSNTTRVVKSNPGWAVQSNGRIVADWFTSRDAAQRWIDSPQRKAIVNHPVFASLSESARETIARNAPQSGEWADGDNGENIVG